MESADQPLVNIIGQTVALGPHRRELLPLYLRWLNDFEVTRTLSTPMRPMTFEAEEAWYTRISRSETDAVFTIYERASMRPIGVTGLHRIDHLHRTAEFGIMIGEKECWGKGYGTEAAALVLDYGFNALGLHNVLLQVYDYNERGLRAYQRAGFREIGRRRQARRLGGQAYDVIFMDCLATEFRPAVVSRLPEGGGKA